MTCRYYGISRQAYYAWYRRYQVEGVDGLRSRYKRPKTSPNATHVQIVGKIIYLRQNYHRPPSISALLSAPPSNAVAISAADGFVAEPRRPPPCRASRLCHRIG
ncbi:helix-turn-helix domain-containing protein [Micromonospora chersina]|uniref:helix-turn-helix domain-containing protein n=1 Tax=Micromonospora chersina TaxID=47854 RepID=UPI00371BC45D